ncbi:MAG: hydroxyacylglutathione hydrolase [Thermoanaerobaculales bacterium]|jgi:hydroxyacylglutathione hydrolase|nr:hydroxyacylglutathione hydrolase [Thermoanaerobaculales bacterium]
MLHVWPVEVLADNYVWVLEQEGSPRVVVVDPGDASPVIAALTERNLEIAAVILTHHHHDHVGGLAEIVDCFHPAVFGAGSDGIPGVDHPVEGGDLIPLTDLDLELEVLSLPGHTANHLGFLGSGIVLVGDTLFAGGCGRIFEGTVEQMHQSLTGLAGLPRETKAYCAHEYTVANLRFGRKVEPVNTAIADRLAAAEAARNEDQPTVPSTIGWELETNVFLRCNHPAVADAAEARVGRPLRSSAEVFGVVRAWKDDWRG